MTRALIPAALLVSLALLAGCKKEEAPAEAAPVALTAPTTADDAAWKEYLGKVVGQNQAGVTDRTFPYYLPMNSDQVTETDADGRSHAITRCNRRICSFTIHHSNSATRDNDLLGPD